MLPAVGAKSEGIFGMADAPPTSLLPLLRSDGTDFFELENLFPYRPGMVWDSRYRIGLSSGMLSNNGQWTGSQEQRRETHEREAVTRRNQLRQVRQRLTEGDTVFLLKDGHGAPPTLIEEIAAAISGAGNGKLLVVRTSDDPHLIGAVRKSDGYYIGYLDRFALRSDLSNHSPNWRRLLHHFAEGIATGNPAPRTVVAVRRVTDEAPAKQPDPVPSMTRELLPTMPGPEMRYVLEQAKASNVVLEFGSGGSTIALAKAGVSLLWSVESDPYWFNRCGEHPALSEAIENQRVNLLYIDIGPISEYGFPQTKQMAHDWSRYHLAIWEKMPVPDLVVIDGRFRVACALQAALRCRPGAKIIVNDYATRPEYAEIGEVLGAPQTVGSLAVFTNPRHLDPARLGLALSAHFMDPR